MRLEDRPAALPAWLELLAVRALVAIHRAASRRVVYTAGRQIAPTEREFVCDTCGQTVYTCTATDELDRCATCRFLAETVEDPRDRIEIRRALSPEAKAAKWAASPHRRHLH